MNERSEKPGYDAVGASPDIRSCLRARRRAIRERLGPHAAVIPAGRAPARNFPANTYPFRASSHFLYCVGEGLENAVVLLTPSTEVLFVPTPNATEILWHGTGPDLEAIAERCGCPTRPLSELVDMLPAGAIGVAPCQSRAVMEQLDAALSTRPRPPGKQADQTLRDALVDTRLVHDSAALQELRVAARVSINAHLAGLRCSQVGCGEWHIRAVMEQHIASEGCVSAYPPIVTTRGQVLHNHDSSRRTAKGDLLLADVGAETPAGWAGDITRTWPVSGRWSPAQSEIYAVVLSAHAAAIATVKPGVRFRDVHLAAARAITRGLVDLDLLRGDPEELTAGGAHALFFPHGVGHLLGLDVHDMEDLGDAAGYPAGRTRAAQFGLHALRLDRELQAGMVVTIEPGFYQVPALLGDAEALGLPVTALNKETIARFPDVKGIRIEDDVLVTEQNCEILTEGLPRDLESVAALAARNT